ncbi:MAG: NAD(P)H-dependent oxidoreductase subunit E [Sporomusaceae bacterium]|nr:NAD(P)H-dependent oxidoreductase subunit E [Sporomusaceae bacterium]
MADNNKVLIEICLGTSCHLLGAEDVLDAVKRLPPEKQEKIQLEAVTCLKNCGKGPNVKVNGMLLSDVTPEKLLGVIEEHINKLGV